MRQKNLLYFGILLLRIGIGVSMMFHGVPKLMAGPELWTGLGSAMGNLGITFAPTFWGFMAAFAESVGGLLFALGLFFRPVSLMLVFNMIVAMLMHIMQGDGFALWGHALDLFIIFTGMLFIGPGKYSFDSKFFPRIA